MPVKMPKKWFALCISGGIVAFLMFACIMGIAFRMNYIRHYWDHGNHDDTRWMSEDGTIVFDVNNEPINGYILINDEKLEVQVVQLHSEGSVWMRNHSDDGEASTKLFEFYYDTLSETRFVLTIRRGIYDAYQNYFHAGDQITFHRVDP